MLDEQYLAFADRVGKTVDGNHIYRLDFTKATDVVWGEQWNVTPAGIEPNLNPDKNCLSLTSQFISKENFQLAKENTCFSMQDCIDGIIPLLFLDPNSPIVLRFGMPMHEVQEILAENDILLTDIKDINEEKDNEVIDNLINNLETQMNDENNGE